jgi:hypothetical protein
MHGGLVGDRRGGSTATGEAHEEGKRKLTLTRFWGVREEKSDKIEAGGFHG